jgi:hypothetical protein
MGPVPVVGRQGELAVLDEVVRETTSGTGSVLFVVGEPGLGKTRLVQERRKRFMAWVGTGSGRLPLWLEGRAASYASSTPYGLYQQLVPSWVGVAPDEGKEVALPALERAMKAVFGGPFDGVALLANMMGLGAGLEVARIGRLSPEGLQRATFAAVRSVVARLLEKGPTVLALEDLHWADPTSLRLTEELVALAADGPLLVLATRRPEPDPGVPNLESSLTADARCPFRTLALSPLSEQAEGALARALIGPGASQGVIEAMCTGVEGNRGDLMAGVCCDRRGQPRLVGLAPGPLHGCGGTGRRGTSSMGQSRGLATRPLDVPLASHRCSAREWECQRSGRCHPPTFGALPGAPAR